MSRDPARLQTILRRGSCLPRGRSSPYIACMHAVDNPQRYLSLACIHVYRRFPLYRQSRKVRQIHARSIYRHMLYKARLARLPFGIKQQKHRPGPTPPDEKNSGLLAAGAHIRGAAEETLHDGNQRKKTSWGNLYMRKTPFHRCPRAFSPILFYNLARPVRNLPLPFPHPRPPFR